MKKSVYVLSNRIAQNIKKNKEQSSLRAISESKMQIDKLLYNINSKSDSQERLDYITNLLPASLDEVLREMIDRVNKFDPDDSQSIDQIRAALKVYQYLLLQSRQLIKNKTFSSLVLDNESFICSLAFYISAEQQSQYLEKVLQLISHQYLTLEQKSYSQSINLFKALLELYESIDEQFYQKLTHLMLMMVVQNIELLQFINHKYYFLQCLIQIVNQEKKSDKLAQLFSQLRKLYSAKNYLLFHEIDLKILVDILLRTLINENENQIIEETLKLYLILCEKPVISKQKYRVEEFHSALKEKLTYIDLKKIEENLKKIIDEIFLAQ